ncbi:PerC family transcriptional regulator [Photorhabdus cinerea]|uniref:PerC family transcriptional regulator n=1 Tax=Photorhabdus cinerea TaxID=471575 RepID=A0A7X5QGB4_9GAMM|nr:PerC family transcriptional regulator [Photorhabdus cinerea]NHB93757.1 hypothetical protein [Photorhabdus cinerea]
MKDFHELRDEAKRLEKRGLFRRAANVHSEAMNWAPTDEERECCVLDVNRCSRKARLTHKSGEL